MKVILTQDVEKLGLSGELVTVKDGYGRNFLIPSGKAVLATKGSIAEVELMRKRAAKKAEISVQEAKELAQKLESSNLTIAVTTGEEDKIHGTVTNVQIADALMEKGIEIDRRSITINSDVKTLGEYTATIHLLGELKPELKFWVVKAD